MNGHKKLDYKKIIFKTLLILMAFVFITILLEGTIRLKNIFRPSKWEPDKKLGWCAPKNYYFEGYKEDGEGKKYSARVTTNEYGFRTFGDVNSKNKKKIFFIGDSVTLSIDVSDEKTFYGIISREMGVEIFAYGGGGYGTLQEYIILDEFIDIIKPDIIIWQYSSSDFINNSYKLELNSIVNNNGKKRPYLGTDGKIFYAIPKPLSYIHEVGNYSYLLYFIISRRIEPQIDRIYSKNEDTAEKYIEKEGARYNEFKESIEITDKLMEKVCQRTQNTNIFAFCSDNLEPFYEEFINISKKNNIKFIGGIPQSINEAEKNGICVRTADKGHWNEEGHRIVAEKIIEYLRKNCNLLK